MYVYTVYTMYTIYWYVHALTLLIVNSHIRSNNEQWYTRHFDHGGFVSYKTEFMRPIRHTLPYYIASRKAERP